jgi:hypothetical protein
LNTEPPRLPRHFLTPKTNSRQRGLPRLFLLEEEYRHATITAGVGWLRGVIYDLRAGRLTWSWEWLEEIFAAHHSEERKVDRTDDK